MAVVSKEENKSSLMATQSGHKIATITEKETEAVRYGFDPCLTFRVQMNLMPRCKTYIIYHEGYGG